MSVLDNKGNFSQIKSKPKAFLVFSVVTAIVIVASGISIASRYSVATGGLAKEAVFTGFSETFADIGSISVQNKNTTLTVKLLENKWVLADRSNYPASTEVVRDVLVGLAELRLKEAKTERKNLYSRLEVEDVAEKDAKSKLMTVKDKSEKVLASLIVGKETSEIAGASDVGRYIRKPGEKRSWLAEGRLILPDTVKNWVSPQFLNVSNMRVDTISVVQPDGQVMLVKREYKTGTKFVIQSPPPNRKIEYQSDVDNMAEGLDKLDLEDVRPNGEIDFLENKTIITNYRMFDGLILNIELFEEKDSKFWGRFKASTEEGASDEIKKEAEQINLKVSNWVYELPGHKFRYMSRKIEDVLEQQKKNDDKKK